MTIESGVSSTYNKNANGYGKSAFLSVGMYEEAPYASFGSYNSNTGSSAYHTVSDDNTGSAPSVGIGVGVSALTNSLQLSIQNNGPNVTISQPAL